MDNRICCGNRSIGSGDYKECYVHVMETGTDKNINANRAKIYVWICLNVDLGKFLETVVTTMLRQNTLLLAETSKQDIVLDLFIIPGGDCTEEGSKKKTTKYTQLVEEYQNKGWWCIGGRGERCCRQPPLQSLQHHIIGVIKQRAINLGAQDSRSCFKVVVDLKRRAVDQVALFGDKPGLNQSWLSHLSEVN